MIVLVYLLTIIAGKWLCRQPDQEKEQCKRTGTSKLHLTYAVLTLCVLHSTVNYDLHLSILLPMWPLCANFQANANGQQIQTNIRLTITYWVCITKVAELPGGGSAINESTPSHGHSICGPFEMWTEELQMSCRVLHVNYRGVLGCVIWFYNNYSDTLHGFYRAVTGV